MCLSSRKHAKSSGADEEVQREARCDKDSNHRSRRSSEWLSVRPLPVVSQSLSLAKHCLPATTLYIYLFHCNSMYVLCHQQAN